MADVGITSELVDQIENAIVTERASDELIAEHLEKAYKAITDNQSVFILETLIKETLKQSVHLGVTREEVIHAINNDLEIVQLEENVYTTRTMMKAETYIIEQLHNQTFSLDDSNKAIERVLEEAEITLSSGQSLAVETISRSNNQIIIVIQGDAGSGKTFAMKVINKTYKDAFDIIGIAPTTQAAKQL